MFRRLIPILLAGLLLSGQPKAETVTNLVIERAEAEIGADIPKNGRFKIVMQDTLVPEAEFISDFWLDEHSGRFIANVVQDDGKIWRVNGFAILIMPIPVMTRKMLPNEIITANDVAILDLPALRVSAFTIARAEDLVGMQVRRVLARGKPVLRQSIAPPIVVTRGERVTIRLRTGALILATNGKALEDGFLGQNVRVINLESKKTILAAAQGNGIVEIKDEN
jgi:flagella basal body P-ring formation protein FlgA